MLSILLNPLIGMPGPPATWSFWVQIDSLLNTLRNDRQTPPLSMSFPYRLPASSPAPISTTPGFHAAHTVNRSDGHSGLPEALHLSHVRLLSVEISQQTRLPHPSALSCLSHDIEGSRDLVQGNPVH